MLFYECAIQLLRECEEELAKTTKRGYYYALQKILHWRPNLKCSELSPELVKEYRLHLVNLGNKPATIAKSLAVLRNFSHKMKERKIISEDPFAGIKIHRVQSHREFLSLEDLKKLYRRFLEHEKLLRIPERNALQAFLFGCFTGLRYSDLKSLTFEEIKDGKIRKQMHKTGDYVYIPLSPQALSLLPKRTSGRCLKVAENSYFNRFLRSGAERLGIRQRLSCHLSRHTFATTCLTLDIPLAATSKLLGHREISTTLIYAKYIDRILDKEMRKFRKFGQLTEEFF